MTEREAEALYAADRIGIRQIRGRYSYRSVGYCALGVIRQVCGLSSAIQRPIATPCPACDGIANSECDLIMHLNDVHEWTFAEIARKLGPDAA